MSPIVLVHIGGAVIGLLSGHTAMIFRKGSGMHGAAGTVFCASMLGMTVSAAYAAVFIKPVPANVIVATLTFYLVLTAWRAARRRDGKIGAFDLAALLLIAADGLAAMTLGLIAASHKRGLIADVPPALYFIFGSVALLCAVSDVRMLRRGSLAGANRLARHLWRMGLALLITTLSFYPGQARFLPKWLRETNVLYVPTVLLVGSMLLWLHRVRRRRRSQADTAFPAEQHDVLIGKAA
jgi:uncharacterized membrane protein